MKIKGIIFDFDGVILESIDVKTRAFAALFSRYPRHREEIIRFHLLNGGMSRFDKFRIIYRRIIKEKLTPKQFSHLCKRFEELVFDNVLKCRFVKGARKALEDCSREFVLFVVSGTPQQEMLKIIDKKGLAKYFKAVYGSPVSKPQAVKNILKAFRLKRNEVVFVGDSITDYNAAISSKIKFIGRLHKDNSKIFRNLSNQFLINDLTGLQEALQSNCQ